MSRRTGVPPAVDLAALVREVAAIGRELAAIRAAVERLADRLPADVGAAEPPPFGTRRGDPTPPEFGSRKAWVRIAKSIPGAVPVGRRWWRLSRSAYAAWLASQQGSPAANDGGQRWTARDALLSVGLRRPVRAGGERAGAFLAVQGGLAPLV